MKLILSILTFFIFFRISKTESFQTTQTVKYLTGIIRHGARREQKEIKDKIKNLYPDPNFGIGDLTPTGMRQEYLLGKVISEKYSHLFGQTFDVNKVKMQASAYNRTIVSGHSFFNGVYDLGSGKDIEYDNPKYYNPPIESKIVIDYKSALPKKATFVPLSVSSLENNSFLTPDNAKTCEKASVQRKILENVINTDHSKDFNPLYQALKEKGFDPKTIFDKDDYDFLSALEVCDVVVSKAYSDSEFKKYDEKLLEQCYYLNTFYGFRLYTGKHFLINTQKFNEKMIDLLNGFSDKTNKKNPNVQLFMAHDTTIQFFLGNFFPDNWMCVLDNYKAKYDKKQNNNPILKDCVDILKFTSNLLFEVIEEEGAPELSINVLYNNVPLFLTSEKKPVPVSWFVEKLKYNIRGDWDDLCRPKAPMKTFTKVLFTVFVLSTCVIVALLVYLCILKRKNLSNSAKEEVYEPL